MPPLTPIPLTLLYLVRETTLRHRPNDKIPLLSLTYLHLYGSRQMAFLLRRFTQLRNAHGTNPIRLPLPSTCKSPVVLRTLKGVLDPHSVAVILIVILIHVEQSPEITTSYLGSLKLDVSTPNCNNFSLLQRLEVNPPKLALSLRVHPLRKL